MGAQKKDQLTLMAMMEGVGLMRRSLWRMSWISINEEKGRAFPNKIDFEKSGMSNELKMSFRRLEPISKLRGWYLVLLLLPEWLLGLQVPNLCRNRLWICLEGKYLCPCPWAYSVFFLLPSCLLHVYICMAVFKLRMAAHRAGSSVFYQGEAAWDKERALG